MSDDAVPPEVTAEDELKCFDREWRAKHPRQLVDMDREHDSQEPRVFVSRSQMIQDGVDYSAAKRAFIRSNPIIQGRLAAEVKGKAATIRATYKGIITVAAAIAATAMRKGKR